MAAPQVGRHDSNTSVATSRSPFERLLVPIDFSWAARDAFKLAMTMADCWSSSVILFYSPGSDGNDEFLDYTGVPWGRGDIIGEAHGQLARFAETIIPGSADRICIDAFRHDDPVKAVADACQRHSPTLVVLGMHGHTRNRWLRSRSERIVRAISCPVMMVRAAPEPYVDADS
jgi:nucleotide-binding universal stress UspA family protein